MTNKQEQPLVSIIMPVYNAQKWVREAVASVKRQTYENWELILVDDGSEDNSATILKSMASRNKKIKVWRLKKNVGLGEAANLGIKKARGKYIARFDADDVMPKYRLGKQVSFLQENPNVVVVGGQCRLVNESGRRIGIKQFPLDDVAIRRMAMMAMSLQAGSMMVNKEKLPKDFVFYADDKKYRYVEDHELLFRLFKYGRVANLPQILLNYRQHDGCSTHLVNHKDVFQKIIGVRLEAIMNGYRPTPLALLVNGFQYALVTILPEPAVMQVYSVLRGLEKIKLPIIRIRPAMIKPKLLGL